MELFKKREVPFHIYKLIEMCKYVFIRENQIKGNKEYQSAVLYGKMRGEIKKLIYSKAFVKLLFPALISFVIIETAAPLVNYELNLTMHIVSRNLIPKALGRFTLCFTILFGKVPEDVCVILLEKYQAEQKVLSEEVEMLEAKINAVKQDENDVDEFIKRLKKYTDVQEPTYACFLGLCGAILHIKT